MKRSEAIEIVREYYPSSGKDLNEALETLIPELKESEDERTRKELIELFRAGANNKSHPYKSDDCKRWLSWLEKQGSQQLANSAKTCKIEPKFKVGDWVVYNDDICQIVKREEGCNKLVTNFGIEKELVNERNLSTARLWTIQDAKDGDVLVASDDSIFLFKGVVDDACKYYIAFTTDNAVKFNEGLEHYWETSKAVHPATKEQYDLLFQKIKEAGYKWDAEKKELRKIEQKPIPITDEWIEDYWKHNKVNNPYFYDKGDEIQFDHDGFIRFCNKYFQKSAWSEEDENEFKWICVKLQEHHMSLEYTERVRKAMSWFKAFKERCTWKPSDEQIKALDNALSLAKNCGEESAFDLRTLHEQLTKLKQ